MHMGVPWQIAIALRKGGRQPHTERVDERGHLERLFQDTIVGGTLRIIRPVCGHILTGIAEGIGPFHPDFFTFHSTLEPLKDTELIVLPVNPDVALVLFEHSVMPAWATPSSGTSLGRYCPLVPRDCLMTARASMTG